MEISESDFKPDDETDGGARAYVVGAGEPGTRRRGRSGRRRRRLRSRGSGVRTQLHATTRSRERPGEEADDAFEFLDEEDAATTKLDLARAYIDMGDEDGAREILTEVLQEGSSEQQQRRTNYWPSSASRIDSLRVAAGRASHRVGVEYDGHAFHGWQRQPGQRSVQQTLEEALSKIADQTVKLTAAGRTDAGVHATQQVAAFTTSAERLDGAWVRGTNSLLPDELSVRWALPVPTDFHARYSATGRRYQYVFLEAERAPSIGRHYVTWSVARLDDSAMHAAAQQLIGEHDFTSFRSASCQAKSPFRCVFARRRVRRFADLVVLDIAANAFLQHMVRNIAGALLQVGRGGERRLGSERCWRRETGTCVGATAPPTGLYLVDVRYGALELPRAQPPLVLRALGDVW